MKSYFCTRQKAVAAALREGRWQKAIELQDHAVRCPSCADLVLVTQTLQQARRETMQALSLEAAGPAAAPVSSDALWWRAELRRRYGAVERMTTPIAFAQRLALVGIPAALLGVIVWQWNAITDWLGWLASPLSPFGSWDPATLFQAAIPVLPLVLIVGLGGILVLSGLAWFLLTEKE
jgi:hypothetical protein